MPNPGETPSAPLPRARGFLHEVMVELRKTTWPTPQEAWRLTVVVIAVVVFIAVYIGVIDFILTQLTIKFGLIK